MPVVFFLLLVVIVVVATEWRERKRASRTGTTTNTHTTETQAGGECCGQHLVCEREEQWASNGMIEYYDDEELDALAGIQPDDYTAAQYKMIDEVFSSLQESDVRGWARSLQQRQIALPTDIREQVMFIIREQ